MAVECAEFGSADAFELRPGRLPRADPTFGRVVQFSGGLPVHQKKSPRLLTTLCLVYSPDTAKAKRADACAAGLAGDRSCRRPLDDAPSRGDRTQHGSRPYAKRHRGRIRPRSRPARLASDRRPAVGRRPEAASDAPSLGRPRRRRRRQARQASATATMPGIATPKGPERHGGQPAPRCDLRAR